MNGDFRRYHLFFGRLLLGRYCLIRIRNDETAILHHTPFSHPLVHRIGMKSRICIEHANMRRVFLRSNIPNEYKHMIAWKSLYFYEFIRSPGIPSHRTIHSPTPAIVFSIQSRTILLTSKSPHIHLPILILRISADISPENHRVPLFYRIKQKSKVFSWS